MRAWRYAFPNAPPHGTYAYPNVARAGGGGGAPAAAGPRAGEKRRETSDVLGALLGDIDARAPKQMRVIF